MASLNLNKVVLAGHLTATPELRQTPNGLNVTSFSIAVNRRVGKGADGQPAQNAVDFFNLVAWRNTADFIARYFKKGSAICITGSIQTRSWQDQQGQRRYATEVVADEAMFVDSRSESGASDGYQTPSFSSGGAITPSFEEHNTDDDLPF